jgi:hypothetical protein
MKMDIQRFARDPHDTLYRGRRRIAGNWGRVYVNNALLFEIAAFESKITADRDDVIIGQSKDSKIVSLTGEGSFTLKKVFSRGLDKLLNNWKQGHDERFCLIGILEDPDTVGRQKERVRLENVWINDFSPMSFSKGEVSEQEITFGFTPEDFDFESVIEIAGEGAVHEKNGGTP